MPHGTCCYSNPSAWLIMSDPGVVLLAAPGPSTNIVYHALRERLPPDVRLDVILEEPVSRMLLLKRRAQRLGLLTVLGHVSFIVGTVPLLRALDRRRVEAIKAEHRLNDSPIEVPVHHVRSANSAEARMLLQGLSPSVVVVNGTRILSRETLGSTAAPFINMHAGITPAYRGVHGGYWALAEGRPDLVGTTVHRVDEGIDTGMIIAQAFFPVTPEDSFWTYPYLHTAAGIPLLVDAIRAALGGDLPSRSTDPTLPSTLRYHPTLWGYLRNRFMLGVR
jgi:folate-dependent phosphoribosylglycinamide formyltransferase PurN